LPRQHKTIPELELSLFVRVMWEHCGVTSEPVEGRPYSVRFVGKPYNTFVPDCPSKQVFAHQKGKTLPLMLSPHVIKAVLAKFDIEEEDFLNIINLEESQLRLEERAEAEAKPN